MNFSSAAVCESSGSETPRGWEKPESGPGAPTSKSVEQAVVTRSSVAPQGPVRTPGTPSAERPTWVIDHAAERLSAILNQPKPAPPYRRKDDL